MGYIGVTTHLLTIDQNFLGHPRMILLMEEIQLITGTYQTLNGINYYYYYQPQLVQKFLPSTVSGIRIPRIQDPLKRYIHI